MFDQYQKSTGTSYTTAVACLAAAIASPAIWFATRPFGFETVSLATASTALCLTMAWVTWRRSSQLSIPSLAVQKSVAE